MLCDVIMNTEEWLGETSTFTHTNLLQTDFLDKCIALRFLNHVGGNFKVISTMKPEGYPVMTDEYKLKPSSDTRSCVISSYFMELTMK